ncbi:hypothetical protein K431DRAFT_226087 [Polychaeton citri CBS 116435]|uniref:Uncharacterized protein n=1 Tax=Polychaeton citri CBS 116435 TaxID=1314669 RepID=A0A9P4Q6U7_9PEZI|nr:hypothetical protein K431DRAFT_226087 [Polychaeton citri CBS 116435]
MAANAWGELDTQEITTTPHHDEDEATVASTPPSVEPIGRTTQRWQSLFHLSPDDAVDRLLAHRNNLTRPRVSDIHWDAVRESAESQGHDRESYEYELWLQQKRATLPSDATTAVESDVVDHRMRYLLELCGPLDSVQKAMRVAGLETVPEIRQGWSVENQQTVEVCCIDAAARAKVLKWSASDEAGGGGWEPTILVDPRSLAR